jgi:hypothetical protein
MIGLGMMLSLKVAVLPGAEEAVDFMIRLTSSGRFLALGEAVAGEGFSSSFLAGEEAGGVKTATAELI